MAFEALSSAFSNASLDDRPVLFSPSSYPRWTERALEPVPRFLFRVYTPRSDGFTDDTVVCSRDANAGKPGSTKDVFATQALPATAKSIADHLRWYWNDSGDNLVSWSSSMLFVIRYIFYRHHNDKTPLDKIHLLVLDTKKFPVGTFIQDLDLISFFAPFDADLSSLEVLRTGDTYYFGEYLSQGSLYINGRCRKESAQSMIDRGLLNMHPALESAFRNQAPGQWAKPVIAIRETIRQVGEPRLDLPELLDQALKIASSFGNHWRFPIAIHLLALMPYRLDADQVSTKLFAGFEPSKKEMDACAKYWQSITVPKPMAELVRGQSIMRTLCSMRAQGQ
ncbi:hypothetical protein Tdes44962_MAKER10401 [Teratosphaeria destructans]|uniref:DUF7587 domain-containing protein n=1 Tax=Teratosphaeria destructans TaxID=418781 RepID=A0A9W7SIV4_9PEZI|nr:hypothetical protein Tdes44962_MAKER10401 [Teratosphaeria destructans]